jgi:hypothetical protein
LGTVIACRGVLCAILTLTTRPKGEIDLALRTFITPEGRPCNVWEVSADSLSNRYQPARMYERRGQDILHYRGPERRNQERRKNAGRLLTTLRDFAGGWLAFECGGEKRRLVPIPPNWDDLPDESLVQLWRRARPAIRSKESEANR